ncbi:MAG: hypothetical protein MMC33_007706 [Icmadophila ericetorum]|nr:hypothetical protein [Icmadophila ericetorum]
MSSSSGRPQLREVHQNDSPKTLVIVVPGVGTAAPGTWFEGRGQSWLHFLPGEVLPSPTIYHFDHGLDPDMDSRIWSNVLDMGLGLLEALLQLLGSRDEFRHCAIVFIAHSLGGIMVKQCLTNAIERTADFRDVVRATASFVAIATPHFKSNEPKDWNQPQLLAGAHSYHKRGHPASLDDANRLASLCLRFEMIATNLHILTLCETEETVIKSLLVRASRTSRAVIVPKDACVVHSRLEEVVEIRANHLDICNVASSLQLERYIRAGIELTSADPPHPLLDESAIADHNAADQEWNEGTKSRFKNVSNQATIAVSDSRRQGSPPLADFSIPKRDPCLPCHIIPNAKNRDFYGRKDVINMIENSLTPIDQHGNTKKDLKTFALCGPGGMGKTQVANEYAITHTDIYEALFWVHAEKATTLADEFSRLAEALGLVLEGTADSRDQVVTRELVKGWLAKPVRSYNRTDNNSDDEVSWLLVFDNVDNADLLSEFWPPTGSSGSILVTSRDPLAKTPFYQIHDGIDLPPMGKQDAADLLLKVTWRENDSEEQRLSLLVAEKLGGMPLALTQMAGVMVRQSLSFNDFLNRYNEEETHGMLFSLSLEPNHKRMNYGYTLASVWALEELKYSSGLLDVMAFLDPGGIPEKYLLGAVGRVHLPKFPETVTAYQDARSELLKSSLIMNDRSASSLMIHRLIQDGARAKMTPNRSTEVFSTAVDVLWSMWKPAELGIRHHVARWKDCELMSPHILRLKEHYNRAGKAAKSRWILNLGFATLLNELGWYFQERGYTTEALECYQIAQANVEHIISARRQESYSAPERHDEDKLLAEIHNNIAGSATELNDASTALHHFQIYNKMLKDEHKDQTSTADSRLTSSFFNLGMSYTMRGDYNLAIPCFKDALIEAEQLSDVNKTKLARSLALINLGLTHWLMDNQSEASEILEMAHKEREELLGPNDRQSMITGRILHCLGNVRRSQELLDESMEFHERALLHFKETVGNNHHRTGNSCFKVGEHYVRTGKVSEAIELLGQACAIFDRHPCYAPEKGRALFLKSIVLDQQGQGESCLQQARSLYGTIRKSAIVKMDLSLEDFNDKSPEDKNAREARA